MKAAVIEICWSSPVMRRKEKVLHNKWASNTPTSGVTVAAAQPNETVMRVGSSAPLSLQAAICLHFILLTFLCCSKRWRNTMEEHFLHLFPQVVVIFCCLCSVCVFKENSRERDLRFLCQLVGMRQQRNAVQKGSKVKKVSARFLTGVPWWVHEPPEGRGVGVLLVGECFLVQAVS